MQKLERRRQPFADIALAVEVNLDNPTQTINNPPSVRGEVNLAEKAELRRRVASRIRRAEPLYVARSDRLGDDFCLWWNHDYVLKKLCAEEEIPTENIQLRSEEPKPGKKHFELSREIAKSNVPNEFLLPFNSTWTILSVLGYSLGVVITADDMKRTPQPLKTDSGVMSKFNRQEVIQTGNAMRQKLAADSQKLAVITQGGSQPEKRLSDKQTLAVAQRIKFSDPTTKVVIVSDKKIAGQRQSLVLESTSDAQVVYPTNINELSTYFYASDLLVATDSFWSWLGTGNRVMREDRNGILQKNDAIVLHTIASPLRWGIPGATTVASNMLQRLELMDLKSGNIPLLFYYGYHGADPKTLTGIQQADIDLLKNQIASTMRIG